MKNVLFVLFTISVLCSCNNRAVAEGDIYGTPITVNVGIGGDISVTTSPDTRVDADNGIYGINVYFDKEKDGKTDDIYAFGLFDNVSDMVITLLSGYKYKFACTFVKNEAQSLYYGQYDGNTYQGFAKPFQTNKHSSTQLGNAFIYSNSTGEYLSGIGTGDTVIYSSTGSTTTTLYPQTHRYYGELDSYTPVAGGVATIHLKKTVFGLKLVIKGVPEGSLNAVVSVNGTEILNKTATTDDYISPSFLRSYRDVSGCWKTEPALPGTVKWSYTSSKFSQWDLSGSSDISFKRNTLTTVTVRVTPDSASASITLSEEEDWDSENTINMGINTDGLIDIIVNPEPED